MAPLRIGGGTRRKTVESLAIGTSVVSTTIAAQCLALEHNANILLADKASSFVDQIARALNDSAWRDQVSISGIATARECFSWKSIDKDFTAALTCNAQQAKCMSMIDMHSDCVTIEETLGRIGSMMASRQSSFIATANVDFLLQAHQDRELHKQLHRADMVVCDDTPLVCLSRMRGRGLPERVAGSDGSAITCSRSAESLERIRSPLPRWTR